MDQEKVYCTKCAYLVNASQVNTEMYYCLTPQNIKHTGGNWLKEETDSDRTPEDLNKDNNCEYFRDKHPDRFLKGE